VADDGTLTMTVNGVMAQMPKDGTDARVGDATQMGQDKLSVDSNNACFISADDINALFGFTYKYDAAANLISFVK